MGLSPKKNQGSLEKQLISGLEQGKYKMNLENLGSDSREVLKNERAICQKKSGTRPKKHP